MRPIPSSLRCSPRAGTATAAEPHRTTPRPGIVKRKSRRAMVAAGVFGFLVVGAGLVVALSESDPVRQDVAANRAPHFNAFARSTPSAQAIPATTETAWRARRRWILSARCGR